MAHQIQRSILKDICTSMWFCVSADETVDISLIEQVPDGYYYCHCGCNTLHSNFLYPQLTICIGYVCPQAFEVFEDCIGLYATDRTDADNLTQLIKDVLARLSLPLERCRGQCYDGTGDMSGRRSGVAVRIQQEEPRALYVHYMGHSLNLAVQDTSRSVKVMADTFDTVLELAKVFKYSANKKSVLLKLKADLSPETMGIRPLCPTRWTVCAESLRSVILNYSVIHSVLEEIIDEYRGLTYVLPISSAATIKGN